MGALLALASAACYGLADFAGGVLSRRTSAMGVALAAQVGALGFTAVAIVFLPVSDVTAGDLAWGGLSGVGTGAGMTFLYRGASRGDLSIVVPLAAVGGVVLPVVVSVTLLGDRPSAAAWAGMALAVPAMSLLLRTPGATSIAASTAAGARADALIASVGIAVQYLAIAQAGAASGIWPIAAGRVTAVLTVLPLAIAEPAARRPRGRDLGASLLVGGVAALALVLYLLATREEIVTVSVVLASLYPVVPVVLGVTLLAERLTRRRTAGLLTAAVAVGLLAGS